MSANRKGVKKRGDILFSSEPDPDSSDQVFLTLVFLFDLVNILDLSCLVQLHRGDSLERCESPEPTETVLGLIPAQGLLYHLLPDTSLHGLLPRVGRKQFEI